MSQVEVSECLEGVSAGDIGVEDEEGGVVFAENVTSEGERSSCLSARARAHGDPCALCGCDRARGKGGRDGWGED